MCEPLVHLQAIQHFGTSNVVPSCWIVSVVAGPDGPMEVFGNGWMGEMALLVTATPSLVTCPACRALVH